MSATGLGHDDDDDDDDDEANRTNDVFLKLGSLLISYHVEGHVVF